MGKHIGWNDSERKKRDKYIEGRLRKAYNEGLRDFYRMAKKQVQAGVIHVVVLDETYESFKKK